MKYLRKTLTRVVVYPERRRDGAYRGRRVAVTAARGCALRGGSERVRGGGVGDRWWRGRGMATAPGAWTPDGSIGDRRRRRHGHRTAAPPRRTVETLPAARRTAAVAAHARPRIELYGTGPRRRRRRRLGRRPDTPTERSSAAAAVSRGTRVIVAALTYRTDFSVFYFKTTRRFFFFPFFPRFYSFCRVSSDSSALPRPPKLSDRHARIQSGFFLF